jgi:hypothetical protein
MPAFDSSAPANPKVTEKPKFIFSCSQTGRGIGLTEIAYIATRTHWPDEKHLLAPEVVTAILTSSRERGPWTPHENGADIHAAILNPDGVLTKGEHLFSVRAHIIRKCMPALASKFGV